VFQRNIDIDRRSRVLATGKRGSGPIVYWLSREQRSEDNWPLLFAQQEALDREKPLLVVFCLVSDYPGATLRHYLFLLAGLAELQKKLASANIVFQLLEGEPSEVLPSFLREVDAHLLVSDFDPLQTKRRWQQQLLTCLTLPWHEVDGHNIIPAWLTSAKREYAAYTIRPKINRLLPLYLTDFPKLLCHPYPSGLVAAEINTKSLVRGVKDHRGAPITWLESGENAAKAAVRTALKERLPGYASNRNDPCLAGQSDLSPYLHFGHISAQRLAQLVQKENLPDESRESFLEELIVRRELADNFCLYEPAYDSFAAFPEWARTTLNAHRGDRRPYLYEQTALEQATTHDPLWNRCQQDLMARAKLHGYLRMYWAKKILEWSLSPEEALATAITLNDRYSLDGRDPNGYAGIAWSIGGVHDRAWPERQVIGKIRSMTEAGCRRKFSVDRYISHGAGNGR
jgi:deoxyribodipyrimidine photo-lyase